MYNKIQNNKISLPYKCHDKTFQMVKERDLTESLGFVICFVCLFEFICEKKTQMKEKGKLRKIAC